MVLGGCGKANTPDTEAVSETTTEVSTETESEATNQAEKETPEESEVPSEEPQAPTYTYMDLYKTMYAKSSVTFNPYLFDIEYISITVPLRLSQFIPSISLSLLI